MGVRRETQAREGNSQSHKKCDLSARDTALSHDRCQRFFVAWCNRETFTKRSQSRSPYTAVLGQRLGTEKRLFFHCPILSGVLGTLRSLEVTTQHESWSRQSVGLTPLQRSAGRLAWPVTRKVARMTLSPEQLELRSSGIGGSEIAEVCGLLPYEGSGPHRVWQRKLGLGEPLDQTHHLLRGTHLGPAVARWAEEKYDCFISHVGRYEKSFRHPDCEICIATPDGLIHNTRTSKARRALEVKAPSRWSAMEWGDDETDSVPEWHIPQGTWEAGAAQLEGTDFVALIDDDISRYPLDYNPQLFDALRDVGERFWRDYVVARKAPPVDGSAAARATLLKLYPHATGDIVEATEVELDLFRKHADIKAATKDLEVAKKTIEQRIMAAIGTHDSMRSELATAHWKMRNCAPAWKKIAEHLMSSVKWAEGERDQLISQFTAEPYRHFQIYPRKRKAGKQ